MQPLATMVGRTHPMTTHLQNGIRKQNPRYALLTSTVTPAIPKTNASDLKHEGWEMLLLRKWMHKTRMVLCL